MALTSCDGCAIGRGAKSWRDLVATIDMGALDHLLSAADGIGVHQRLLEASN